MRVALLFLAVPLLLTTVVQARAYVDEFGNYCVDDYACCSPDNVVPGFYETEISPLHDASSTFYVTDTLSGTLPFHLYQESNGDYAGTGDAFVDLQRSDLPDGPLAALDHDAGSCEQPGEAPDTLVL